MSYFIPVIGLFLVLTSACDPLPWPATIRPLRCRKLLLAGGEAYFRGRRVMKSTVIKRSIVVAGRKTSVSLEVPFWNG